MHIVAITKLMDLNKSLDIFFINYQLDLVLQMNFVSDNILLIFSQSNVNIIIDTKLHPIILSIYQIKQNRLTEVRKIINKRNTPI